MPIPVNNWAWGWGHEEHTTLSGSAQLGRLQTNSNNDAVLGVCSEARRLVVPALEHSACSAHNSLRR
jgi:hypothetical protein